MLNKSAAKNRNSFEFLCLEECIPEGHLVRSIERYIDFSFIYDLVEPLYSPNLGRPSVDPVLLIKIPILQFLFGIPSMRKAIEEIEVNLAYRWFLGLGFTQPVPHFTTFGKNYKRRFEGTDLFEQIFEKILMQVAEAGLIDSRVIFVDSTPVKAHANRNKKCKLKVRREVKQFEKNLRREINDRREEDQMKPFDDPDEDESGEGSELTKSPNDPEAGMFIKGEHRRDFAYSLQVGCDKYGWVLGYAVSPGNVHDSRSFHDLLPKLSPFEPDVMVMDAGYKSPVVAKVLLDKQIQALFPYTRPKGTKKAGYRKRDFYYDEISDHYICPQGEELLYKRVGRQGYQYYESSPKVCRQCAELGLCTTASNSKKVLARHLYQEYLDQCDTYRLTEEGKTLYRLRKQTIERVFAEGKENHGLRFTRQVGKNAMGFKVALSLLCINMKKYAKLMDRRHGTGPFSCLLSSLYEHFFLKRAVA